MLNGRNILQNEHLVAKGIEILITIEPGLLGRKIVNGRNFDVIVAKCLLTRTYTL